MYIVRAKTGATTKTFSFTLLEAAEKAAKYVQRTECAGFIAECEDESAMKGRILKKWEGDRSALNYIITCKAYADYKWGILGTEMECIQMSSETNAKATCWADVTAHVEHIVGPLWVAVFTDPYKD